MAKKKRKQTKTQKYKNKIKFLYVALASVIIAFLLTVFLKSPFEIKETFKEVFKSEELSSDIIFPKDGEVEVTIIDVGQGLSTYVNACGKHILIDGGENEYGYDIVDFLKARKVESLELVIATHPHQDHIGGLDDVINNIETKMILMPPMKKEQLPASEEFSDLISSIREREIKYVVSKPGQIFNFGSGAVLTVLGPQRVYNDLNNLSVVSRLDFGDVSFMFTGDAELDAENDLLKSKFDLDVDVLSAGHHGSSSSTGKNFLLRCSPKHVNISCGKNNSHGHPNDEVIELLEECSIPYARTDLNGNITYITNGKDLQIYTEK